MKKRSFWLWVRLLMTPPKLDWADLDQEYLPGMRAQNTANILFFRLSRTVVQASNDGYWRFVSAAGGNSAFRIDLTAGSVHTLHLQVIASPSRPDYGIARSSSSQQNRGVSFAVAGGWRRSPSRSSALASHRSRTPLDKP
jgi:hypothetical protein